MERTKAEHFASRHENPEFIRELRLKLADEIEELSTNPKAKYIFSERDMNMGETIRGGGKFSKEDKSFYDLFIRVCQDYRLTPEQIDVIRDIFTY